MKKIRPVQNSMCQALCILAVYLALAAGHPALAQNNFTADDGAFSLSLPQEFVQIPALEMYLRQHPGGSSPVAPEALAEFGKTHYGFPAPADKWFTPPSLIITLEQGKKRTAQELFMDHVLAESDSEKAAGTDSRHRFLTKEYLPLKRMHHYTDVSRDSTLGVDLVTGHYTYLTSRGFLRISWFMPQDQREQYEKELHQAAMNLKLSPDLQYQGR